MNLKPFEWADEVDQKELLSKLPAGAAHATPESPRAPRLPEPRRVIIHFRQQPASNLHPSSVSVI